MKPEKRLSKLVLCVPAALFFLVISFPLYGASSKLLVNPDPVRIGALYNGKRVNLSAEIPRGCDVIVEVTGRDTDEAVVQKVRRFGLWMNGGEIVVRGAPSLYLAMSSEPALPATPPENALWGYEALKKRVSFSGHIKETGSGRIFEAETEIEAEAEAVAAAEEPEPKPKDLIDDLSQSLIVEKPKPVKQKKAKRVIIARPTAAEQRAAAEEAEKEAKRRGRELVFDEELGEVVTKRKRKGSRRRQEWDDFDLDDF